MIAIVLLLGCILSIEALPQGAPSTVCQTMTPFHGGGIPPQNGIPPYIIATRRRGGTVLVSLGSTVGVRFQGFLIQGRTLSGDILGSFDAGSPDGHFLNCTDIGDSLTHNSPSVKDVLEVVWRPPREYEGLILFNATIAQSYDTFWIGVTSQPTQISRRSIDDDPLPDTAFFPNSPLSTPPNFTPQQHAESSTEFDPFYDGCTVNKLCFGAPANCVNSKNCKAVVAITVTGDKYDFELKADSEAAWVGVGLSNDNKMGEDSVIECVKRGTGVATYMSWTAAAPYSATRLSNPLLGIQMLNGSVVDGVIYCKVRRDVETNVNGNIFDLANQQYNLLIAAGSSVTETSVGFHDVIFLASAQQQALSDVSALAADSKLLIRIHGSFMIVAWIGTASIGILLARYFRQTWVGTTLMGKDVWFAWHRIFMVLTWLLTMAAFVLIFVELKAWSRESNPHAVLGTITTILCFFQPIGAYFRPHPGTPKRPIFNWLHWLVGNTAHIVGIITIFFAVKLTKAELPEFVDWILVAYVVVHVVTHLLLSIVNCIFERSSEGKVTSFPMMNMGSPGRNSVPYTERSGDTPFSLFRKILLAIYMLLIIAIIIVLVVITALAPIEDTWTALKSSIKSN